MKVKCCGTCKYGRYDKMQGYVCVNGDSDYCAVFVEHDFTCEEWEVKNAKKYDENEKLKKWLEGLR